jgi:hypothetical protein
VRSSSSSLAGLLPRGGIVPVHVVQESELLLIDKGTIEATVIEGEIWRSSTPGVTSPYSSGSKTFEAGERLAVTDGSAATYQTSGTRPATFWLVTVRSTDSGASG